MKTLTYWIAPTKRKDGESVRAKTRRECKALRHKSYQWEPQKVTIPYSDLVDLITKVIGTHKLNLWEAGNGKHI